MDWKGKNETAPIYRCPQKKILKKSIKSKRFSNVAAYKANTHKSITFLYTGNEHMNGKI